MYTLKAFGRWLFFFIFHLSIIFLISTVSLVLLLGDRNSTKAVIDDSGVYDEFVDAFVLTAANESQGEPNSLPFDDPEVIKIANESFDSKVLKSAGDHVLDSVYDWVEGSKDELEFEINFSAQVDKFIEGMSAYAVNKYESLPPCTAIDNVSATVFNLTCQPSGSSAELIRQYSKDDLMQQDFLNNPVLSDETIFSSEDQKDDLEFLPETYRATRLLPVICILVIFISGILFILLHRSRRRGVKRIGSDMVTTAVFIALLTLVFGFVLPHFTDTFSVQGEGLPRLFNNVIEEFLQNLDIVVINISIVLVSVGATVLIIEKMSRPENIYAEVAKKAGLSSSTPKKSGKRKKVNPKKAPIQTSETKKKARTRRKSKKYRKIGL